MKHYKTNPEAIQILFYVDKTYEQRGCNYRSALMYAWQIPLEEREKIDYCLENDIPVVVTAVRGHKTRHSYLLDSYYEFEHRGNWWALNLENRISMIPETGVVMKRRGKKIFRQGNVKLPIETI